MSTVTQRGMTISKQQHIRLSLIDDIKTAFKNARSLWHGSGDYIFFIMPEGKQLRDLGRPYKGHPFYTSALHISDAGLDQSEVASAVKALHSNGQPISLEQPLTCVSEVIDTSQLMRVRVTVPRTR